MIIQEEVKTTNRKRSISLIENKNDKRLCIESKLLIASCNLIMQKNCVGTADEGGPERETTILYSYS